MKKKSEFLKSAGTIWQIMQAIINAVLNLGGDDNDLRRILTLDFLAEKIARVIMATKSVGFFDTGHPTNICRLRELGILPGMAIIYNRTEHTIKISQNPCVTLDFDGGDDKHFIPLDYTQFYVLAQILGESHNLLAELQQDDDKYWAYEFVSWPTK